MYEKIPIKLVQAAVKKRWHNIQENTLIPWKTFNEMITLCVKDGNYLTFNGKFYQQIDGLTIGGIMYLGRFCYYRPSGGSTFEMWI